MYLLIDTSADEAVRVAAVNRDGVITRERVRRSLFRHGETLLPLLHQLLQMEKLSPSEIGGIIVVSGPGGFTGLRQGITSANALGYAWQVPVTGITAITTERKRHARLTRAVAALRRTRGIRFVVPRYGHPAHITKPKRRDP